MPSGQCGWHHGKTLVIVWLGEYKPHRWFNPPCFVHQTDGKVVAAHCASVHFSYCTHKGDPVRSSPHHLPSTVLLVSNVLLLKERSKKKRLKGAGLSQWIPKNTELIVRNRINSV